MNAEARYLNPSEAAGRIGLSVKALRVWERHGLLAPSRTATGWRAYSPADMDRARDIAALRQLGFSLSQVARLLDGDMRDLDPELSAHQAALERQMARLGETVARVRELREALAGGDVSGIGAFTRLAGRDGGTGISFDLPWPWGGERFELRRIRPLNYIIGPLGSGKTRFAQKLAETLPDAAFLGLERDMAAAPAVAGPGHAARVARTLDWIAGDGGTPGDELAALVAHIEADRPAALVIDMIEQGLDQATQEALIARLRARGPDARPLFMLTRSSAILDLAAVGPDEAIVYCPANHSPPIDVPPHAGAAGYESVRSCLAPPDVRARTEGVVAMRPAANT